MGSKGLAKPIDFQGRVLEPINFLENSLEINILTNRLRTYELKIQTEPLNHKVLCIVSNKNFLSIIFILDFYGTWLKLIQLLAPCSNQIRAWWKKLICFGESKPTELINFDCLPENRLKRFYNSYQIVDLIRILDGWPFQIFLPHYLYEIFVKITLNRKN